jgi:hypothetical protein
MTGFRVFLVAVWATIFIYTGVVIADHGWGLFQIFFGDIARMSWPGQFNLDFMFMLTLSALWVAWRHQYSAGGLALAFVAAVGGSAFLSVYLLVVSFQAKGDVRALLLGARTLP